MLRHTTLDQLHELKLLGMAKALAEQLSMHDVSTLSFEERLGLLVEREAAERSSRRLIARLRKANLREQARSKTPTGGRAEISTRRRCFAWARASGLPTISTY